MKRESNNVWAALDDEHLHRVAFVDGLRVVTVCNVVGEPQSTYHVDHAAGSNAAPAVYPERHCGTCKASRSSFCPCGFRTHLAPDTARFHAAHRDHHLLAYPLSDARTRASLDRLVESHLGRELGVAGVVQPPVGVLS